MGDGLEVRTGGVEEEDGEEELGRYFFQSPSSVITRVSIILDIGCGASGWRDPTTLSVSLLL